MELASTTPKTWWLRYRQILLQIFANVWDTDAAMRQHRAVGTISLRLLVLQREPRKEKLPLCT